MNRLLFIILLFINMTICFVGNSQNKNKRELDLIYLNPVENKLTKFLKSGFNKVFKNFKENDISVISGINFSKQIISTNSYSSPFNYLLNDINKNVSKPGYYGGIRIDGLYKYKTPYSLLFTLNKFSTGTFYKDNINIDPIIGKFSNFKAEEQFVTIKIAPHYKKLIPIFNDEKYKLNFIIGPSIDYRLSKVNIENSINNNYNKIFISGDIGLEFNNQDFYTLFIHYQQGLTSITKTPIQVKLNRFDLGFIIKASDLF